MIQRLRILFVSAETTPFAHTGGLGEVVGALPLKLAELGHDVRVVMPLYQTVRDRGVPLQRLPAEIDVPLVIGTRTATVWQGALGASQANNGAGSSPAQVPVYFIEQDAYFARPGLYGDQHGDYEDNALRFLFFSRAVLALPQATAWFPHIFHCHDWHTALVPAFLRHLSGLDKRLTEARSIFTIHNLAYQGQFPSWVFGVTGLPSSLNQAAGLEFYGGTNFMKAGLYYADHLTTVSPSYAREICMPEGGFGLDGVLRERQGVLTGILNDVEYRMWNPATDHLIPAIYSANDLRGKAVCKSALQRFFSLPDESATLVCGIISRLVEQKGIDLVLDAARRLLTMNLQLIILGSGDARFESRFVDLARQYPNQAGVRLGFDNALAHQIQAGSDCLLMPSRYEPCGLTQIYSLRYGTVPIVRAVGGLKDTVEPVDVTTGQGTGFVFDDATPEAFLAAVRAAVDAYSDQSIWRQIVYNGMQQDYSWDRSTVRYLNVYRHVVAQGEEVMAPTISFGTSGL